jgi:hypothetical protein
MHENKKVAKRTAGGHFRQAATSIKHEKIPPSPDHFVLIHEMPWIDYLWRLIILTNKFGLHIL